MAQRELTVDITNLAATEGLARAVADSILSHSGRVPLTIALQGSLGAGKTQWVRYLCAALGIPSELVTSPTYVLLQRYAGLRDVYHLDFYRLESEAQVWDLGIDELYEQPVVVLVEWADKFPACLPDDCMTIQFQQRVEGGRVAELRASGANSRSVIDGVRLAP